MDLERLKLELTEQEQRHLDSLLEAHRPYPPEFLTEEKAARLRDLLKREKEAGRLPAVLVANGLDPDPDKWPRVGEHIGNPIPQEAWDAVREAVNDLAMRRYPDRVQRTEFSFLDDRVNYVAVHLRPDPDAT
jgi:hypothetical protein